MMSPWLAACIGLVLGAVVGSFLATLVVRWPEGRTVSRGRSKCDECGATLRAWELVPIFSALIQSGRCRNCHRRMDPVHWQMECCCALAGALAGFLSVGLLPTIGWALFGWTLITLAFLDGRHFWLPDALTLPLIAAGVAVSTYVSGVSHTEAVIGAIVGGGVLWGISALYRALRKRDGLGLGDAKLFAAIGAWLGAYSLPFIMMLASLIGLVWIVIQRLRGRGQMNGMTRVPLGTFLCLAAVPGWWLGIVVAAGY